MTTLADRIITLTSEDGCIHNLEGFYRMVDHYSILPSMSIEEGIEVECHTLEDGCTY